MIKFNSESKDILTYGECLKPAMEITDKENAKQYLNEYADYIQKHLDTEPRNDNMTALEIAKTNIGYYAGYYDRRYSIGLQSCLTLSTQYLVTTCRLQKKRTNADYKIKH